MQECRLCWGGGGGYPLQITTGAIAGEGCKSVDVVAQVRVVSGVCGAKHQVRRNHQALHYQQVVDS